MREWGFLGGSFDPIHIGHLNVAIQMAEIHNLEKVWICPATTSPSKVEKPPYVSAEHRYNMVQLAVSDIPNLEPLDLEIKRPGPSFTIDTIRELLQDIPKDVRIRLIIADDLYQSFNEWKEHETLEKMAPLLVANRTASSCGASSRETSILRLEVSSTLIRARLKKKLYCGHLVPHKVLDYIQKHKLYV